MYSSPSCCQPVFTSHLSFPALEAKWDSFSTLTQPPTLRLAKFGQRGPEVCAAEAAPRRLGAGSSSGWRGIPPASRWLRFPPTPGSRPTCTWRLGEGGSGLWGFTGGVDAEHGLCHGAGFPPRSWGKRRAAAAVRVACRLSGDRYRPRAPPHLLALRPRRQLPGCPPPTPPFIHPFIQQACIEPSGPGRRVEFEDAEVDKTQPCL